HQGLIGIFFGLAIATAAIRLILQIRTYRCLHVDDYFHIFACLCLTAGTILGYIHVGNLYHNQKITYNPQYALWLAANDLPRLVAAIETYQKLYYVYTSLLWTSIFAVKVAYLGFFRRLIDRIRSLIVFWRVVLGITIVSFPVCVLSIYLGCTKWGLEASSELRSPLAIWSANVGAAVCTRPSYVRRSLGLAIFSIILDIGTDLLIIIIPIRLLWSVKIKLGQKIVLGLFLSLNLFMMVVASIRISGLDFRGKIDIVWLFLWQQIEASVAVAMISLTAFRSVFVASNSNRARKKAAKQPWYSSTVAALKRKGEKQSTKQRANLEMPTLPSASMTGMRSFIQGKGLLSGTTGQDQSLGTVDHDHDQWPLHRGADRC
ncbi:MAG: hypothetical protein Q9183_001383, partial [Haloplaca sp. 2 TL-2023]